MNPPKCIKPGKSGALNDLLRVTTQPAYTLTFVQNGVTHAITKAGFGGYSVSKKGAPLTLHRAGGETFILNNETISVHYDETPNLSIEAKQNAKIFLMTEACKRIYEKKPPKELSELEDEIDDLNFTRPPFSLGGFN